MAREAERYLAFMLRFRREAGVRPWRVTLVNPHTSERHSFVSLEELFQFLEKRLAQPGQPEAD